jgi:hypothetical protein
VSGASWGAEEYDPPSASVSSALTKCLEKHLLYSVKNVVAFNFTT